MKSFCPLPEYPQKWMKSLCPLPEYPQIIDLACTVRATMPLGEGEVPVECVSRGCKPCYNFGTDVVIAPPKRAKKVTPSAPYYELDEDQMRSNTGLCCFFFEHFPPSVSSLSHGSATNTSYFFNFPTKKVLPPQQKKVNVEVSLAGLYCPRRGGCAATSRRNK